MSKVAVVSEVLRWAMDRSGLTEEDLQDRLPRIREWLAGRSHPTLRQLEFLAAATRTPFGCFFLDEPPKESLPVPHFRTLGAKVQRRPSPDLLESIETTQRRQSWMRESLIEQGEDPLPFVRSARVDEQPQTIVRRMWRALGLEKGWAASYRTWTDALRALRTAMDDAGILAVVNGIVGNDTHRKLDPAEFRGFVLVDDYAPLVFVNGADGKAAQMFTLAHELAHVFFGSSARFESGLRACSECSGYPLRSFPSAVAVRIGRGWLLTEL